MRFEVEIKGNPTKPLNKEVFEKAMFKLGLKAETHARNTINTFRREDGRKQGVHTGAFRDTLKVNDTDDGFVLRDSVPYGIYHEFGTTRHFVPFVDKSGSLTSLGQWAILNFELLGFGAQTQRRATREEIVRKKGGMMVDLDEMSPFRKAIKNAEENYKEVFQEEINNAKRKSKS